MGIIIGASIFVQPSEVTARMPSVAGVLLAWVAAGALTFVGARVCAEFAARLPRSGGVYVYLTEAFGPRLGFLWGWAMFWTMHTGIIAAIAVIFARYAGVLFPMDALGAKLVAIGAIAVLTALNYGGVKQGSRFQAALTLVKVLAIAAIVIVGFALGSRLPQHFAGATGSRPVRPGDFLGAMAAGLFAFGGWHMVSYTAGETADPRRTIPRALWLGTLIVTVAYVALNTVYLYVLPLDQVRQSPHVAADLAAMLLGSGAGSAMALVVMISSFGALAGVVLTGPRVYLAMAEDGLLFRWVGAVHPIFRTPHRAIVLQGVWASALVATGTFRALFTRVVYTEWIFFGLMAIGLAMVRRSARWQEVLFSLVAFAVAVNQILSNPLDAVLGLGLVLTGLPVYEIIRRSRSTARKHA